MIRQLAVAMALALAAPADAAMDYAEDDSFKLVVAHVIQATPDQIYRMLGQPRRWWSSAHTYSGDARNLKMELRAGGCFCETMPKGQGSIEHGRVVQAMKGKLLRLSAPLHQHQFFGHAGVQRGGIVELRLGQASLHGNRRRLEDFSESGPIRWSATTRSVAPSTSIL
jgi:uncharacterized protein YndB with AHSA1/START domain